MMVKQFLVCFILLLVIDSVYLYMNAKHFNDVVGRISGKELTQRYYSAALVYIALALGLVYFVLPHKKDAIKYGFLFGLITYAVFDFTTHFMFRDWDIKTSIKDTLWGGVLCATASLVSLKILARL